MNSDKFFDNYAKIYTKNTQIVYDNSYKIVSQIGLSILDLNGTRISLQHTYVNNNMSFLCSFIDTYDNICQDNCSLLLRKYSFVTKVEKYNGNLYVSTYCLKKICNKLLNFFTPKDMPEMHLLSILRCYFKENKIHHIQNFSNSITLSNLDLQWMKQIESNIDNGLNTTSIILQNLCINLNDTNVFFYKSQLENFSKTNIRVCKKITYYGGCIMYNGNVEKIFKHILLYNKQHFLCDNKRFKATLVVCSRNNLDYLYHSAKQVFKNTKKTLLCIKTIYSFYKFFKNFSESDVIFIPFSLGEEMSRFYFHSIYLDYSLDNLQCIEKNHIFELKSLYRWCITNEKPLLYINDNTNPFLFFTDIRTDFTEMSIIESIVSLYRNCFSEKNVLIENIPVTLTSTEKDIKSIIYNDSPNLLRIDYSSYKTVNCISLRNKSNFIRQSIEDLKKEDGLLCIVCYEYIESFSTKVFFQCGHYLCTGCYSKQLYYKKSNQCVLHCINKNLPHFIFNKESLNYTLKYESSKLGKLLSILEKVLPENRCIVYTKNESSLSDICNILSIENIKFCLKKFSNASNLLILSDLNCKKFFCNMNVSILLMVDLNESVESFIVSRLSCQNVTLHIMRFISAFS
jgi:hypothetical protein